MQHPRGRAGRTGPLLLAAAALIALAACSGPSEASPSPATKTPVQRRSAPAERPTAAEDALASALVDGWTPEGYGTSPVASGADWAAEPATGFEDDALAGRHLLQIACSGTGAITVQLTATSPGRRVPCGAKAAAFPFTGKVHATFAGEAANTGRYAWRILAAT